MNPQGQTGVQSCAAMPPPWINLTWMLFDEKGKRIRGVFVTATLHQSLCKRPVYFTPPTVKFQLLICWETSYLAALISLSFQFLFISFSKLLWQIVLHVGGCMKNIPQPWLCHRLSGVYWQLFFTVMTLDQDHFPHIYLLSCHILKEHVRSHPDEQAAEKQRMTVVRSFQQLFRKSSNVLLMHITAKMLNLILEKLHSPFPMATEKPLLL